MADLRELDIRHLIALDAVAEHGTFGRAAEHLGYTQSAVSQQISALERLVGGSLFDRPGGPRPPELTPLGERLVEAARDLLHRVDDLGRDLDRFQRGEIGQIRVGSFQSISTTLLPLVVGQMRSEFPDVTIRVFETDLDQELEGALERGETDVSFLVGDPGGGFEIVPLLEDPFVLMARPDQFPPGPVHLDLLLDEPMIGQRNNSCQLMNEAGLRAAGLDPNYVFRSNDNGTVSAMVRAGMGVAVMPALCVEPDDPRLEIHPIEPAMPARSVGIAWRAGRTLSPSAVRFVEVAKELAPHFAARSVVVAA